MARARLVHRPENCRAYFAGLLPFAKATLPARAIPRNAMATPALSVRIRTIPQPWSFVFRG